jgi:hypothetical protein
VCHLIGLKTLSDPQMARAPPGLLSAALKPSSVHSFSGQGQNKIIIELVASDRDSQGRRVIRTAVLLGTSSQASGSDKSRRERVDANTKSRETQQAGCRRSR